MRLFCRLTPLAVVLAFAGLPAARAEMTFRCSFDGRVAPEVHRGEGAPLLAGKADFVAGVRGQGLVVGDGAAELQYPLPGNYDLRESAVSFWVKPLNWEGSDDKFHIFFQAAASLPGGVGNGARLLYKYLVPGRFLILAIPDDPVPYVNYQGACYADITAWRPGEWHHVVGCWRGSGQTLYLDGKPVGGHVYHSMPMKMGNRFYFGDRTWAPGRDAQSVVDELTIYDRSLNAAEVEILYRRPKAETLTVSLRPFFLSGTVEAYVDTSSLPEGTRLRGTLLRAGKPIAPPAEATVQPREDILRLRLPLKGVSAGAYQVVVTAPGHRVATTLDVPPPPPWLGTRVGISERVPQPWTPVVEQGGTVSCWNRAYTLAPGPFPQQIQSNGGPLLAGPVELQVTTGSQAVTWDKRRLQVQRRSATEVAFTGSAVAGSLRLAVSGRIEYDGMCWFDVALAGPAGAAVDRIALEVPVGADAARFWQGVFTRPREKQAGDLPDRDGTLLDEAFLPALWLGSDDRGIQWFTESSEPWDDPTRKGSVRLVREGDRVALRVEPVASGLRLEKPWRFSFGLQASPVRPVVPDWRRYRFSGVPGTTHLIWANKKDMVWFGYPRARDPEALTAQAAALHKRNVRVIPYSTPFLLSIESPESRLYGPEWLRVGEGDSGSSDVAAMGGCAQYVPPGARHYADFTTWAHQRYVRETGFGGLYFDISGLSPLDYEPAGCGYRRDGVLIPTYPLLAKRELMKRMYVMLKEMSPDHSLVIHCSGQAVLPIHGFADVRAMGEDLGMRLAKKPSYHEILTEAEWRAIQCGHAYGFSNFLLPMLKSAADDPIPMEQAMGLMLLYNMELWPGYGHQDPQRRVRKACERFGIIGAAFTPFWQPDLPVTASHPAVRVSLYRHPGRAMLVLVNKAAEPVTATLSLDAATLGVAAGAPWKDLVEDQPMEPGAPITLEPGSYRAIQVGREVVRPVNP